MKTPELLPNPDFEALKAMGQDYIKDLAEKGYADEDDPHYIYEAAIEALFGKDVWKFINNVKMKN